MSTDLVQERYRTARVVGHYTALVPTEHQPVVPPEMVPRSCDCCGQGLIHINLVRLSGGEVVALGNDCVERVGLSSKELKAWWAVKFAEQRMERAAHRAKVRAAEERAKVDGLPERDVLIAYYEEAEAEANRRGYSFDPNARWRSNDVCFDFQPEAVTTGYWLARGDCTIPAFNVVGDAAKIAGFTPARFRDCDPEDMRRTPALFDLAGNLLDAKLVTGQYGLVWRVADGSGGVRWFNPSKARVAATERANNAKKGYYVGSVLRVTWPDGGRRNRWVDHDLPPVAILDNGQELS